MHESFFYDFLAFAGPCFHPAQSAGASLTFYTVCANMLGSSLGSKCERFSQGFLLAPVPVGASPLQYCGCEPFRFLFQYKKWALFAGLYIALP